MTEGLVSRQCGRKHHGDCVDVDCECACHPGGVITVPDDAFTAVAEPTPPREVADEPPVVRESRVVTPAPAPQVAAPAPKSRPPIATRAPDARQRASDAPEFEVFTHKHAKPPRAKPDGEPTKPRANRLADRGLDPKQARVWAIANDIEVPARGPLSVAAMDAYIAAVDAGTVEPREPVTSAASGSSTIQESGKTGNGPGVTSALEVLAPMSLAPEPTDEPPEVDSADEPAGPDVGHVASSPLQSDGALVWRVACAVGRTCTWCRERQPDRDTAVALGRAHIADKHADSDWEFRVQGIRPATAAGPGEVVEDEEITADLRSVLATLVTMADMVERLHQVPFDVAPDLDDEVFIQVAACNGALEALCKVHGVALR